MIRRRHAGPLAQVVRVSHNNKIFSAAEAVALIHDGDTVTICGFVGVGFAEVIAVALEERFEQTYRQGIVAAYRGDSRHVRNGTRQDDYRKRKWIADPP